MLKLKSLKTKFSQNLDVIERIWDYLLGVVFDEEFNAKNRMILGRITKKLAFFGISNKPL